MIRVFSVSRIAHGAGISIDGCWILARRTKQANEATRTLQLLLIEPWLTRLAANGSRDLRETGKRKIYQRFLATATARNHPTTGVCFTEARVDSCSTETNLLTNDRNRNANPEVAKSLRKMSW